MRDVLAELKHGARLLIKNRSFTAVAVLTLAIGVGANTAIFSVVDGVLLRPFPFRAQEQLVVLWEQHLSLGFDVMFVAPPNYADWRAQAESFSEIAAFTTRDVTLEADVPERIRQGRVSSSLFDVLGVPPAAGRVFTEDEDRPGAGGVVVVSHGFAEGRFGSIDRAMAQELILDGRPHAVVGIMPPGFSFPPPIALEGEIPAEPVELWVPLAIDYASSQRGAHYLTVLGRLGDGVTRESASTEMTGIARNLAEAYPSTNEGWDVAIVPLVDQVTGSVRTALLVLFAAVGCVLLIACVNVANLLLTRGVARQREMAVRAALGAGQGRLVRQLLVESMLLAVLGGLLGAIFAFWGVRAIVALAPANLPRLADVSFDSTTALFTGIVCLGAAVVFSLAPALAASSTNLIDGLRERDTRAQSARGNLLGRGLVVLEVALALVLLVSAVLLIRSFANLRAVDPGFRAERVLTVRTTLPRASYDDVATRIRFVEQAMASLSEVPEVDAAGAVNEMPLAHDRQGTSLAIEGAPEAPSGQEPQTSFAVVSPGYFRSMGVELTRGRDFTPRDDSDRPRVVIINETLAAQHFPGEDPLGRRIRLGMSSGEPFKIIGVARDVRHLQLSASAVPNTYVHYAQQPRSFGLTFILRTQAEPATALASVRRAIHDLDPSLPLFDAQPLQSIVDQSMAQQRFSTRALAVFAAAALLLACIGLYGVMSYSVSQRVPEIGLRLALGAAPTDISKLVLSNAGKLAVAGIVIGLLLALGVTRILASLLYDVQTYDLASFVFVGALLLSVALLSAYLPARRASRIDPMAALRPE